MIEGKDADLLVWVAEPVGEANHLEASWVVTGLWKMAQYLYDSNRWADIEAYITQSEHQESLGTISVWKSLQEGKNSAVGSAASVQSSK